MLNTPHVALPYDAEGYVAFTENPKVELMKGWITTIMVLMCLFLMVGAVSAAGNANFVTLVAKDPATWEPIEGGAWGKMMFKEVPKPMFVFNGKGLLLGQDYSLINYFDPWGSVPQCAILGTGVANDEGCVNIKGNAAGFSGKIWLVPSKDLTGTQFNAWNPTEYLFETALI